MKLTLEQVKQMIPANKQPQQWVDWLNEILPAYNVNTKERIAAFIAETAHESMDFTRTQENLNYSVNGLMTTWPSRFKTVADAAPYARNAEKIANKVYAGRMGNSPIEAIGDGWRYRGRGILQITGKDNYKAFSQFKFNDDRLVTAPEQLANPPLSLEAACWFWIKHGLNEHADKCEIAAISKTINGGEIGLAARDARFKKNLSIL